VASATPNDAVSAILGRCICIPPEKLPGSWLRLESELLAVPLANSLMLNVTLIRD